MITHRIKPQSFRRQGLTLLEVVTALFIFLVGLTALYTLIQNASYRAIRVEWKAQASLRCQSKLAEVVIGAQYLESTELQPFSDDETWRWQIQAEEELEGLFRVRVEVQREMPNGELIRAELSQMVVPPTMRGSTLDASPTTPMPTTPKSGSSTMPDESGTTETPSGTTGGSTPATTTPAATTPAPTGGGAPKGGGKR